MYLELQQFVAKLVAEHDQIPTERKARLQQLADYIRAKGQSFVPLHFICTHNSRRSHMGMIWAALAAHHFGLTNVATYSGGTEATAFNPRAVAALVRVGFRIRDPGGDNPHYQVAYASDQPALRCFSKTVDHPVNPTANFAAIMTCSDADSNCPFLPGAELRLPLTYEDPKATDDTPEEMTAYDERLRQIGRELLWCFGELV